MSNAPTVSELLINAARLDKGDFDEFFHEILSLRARRTAPVLSKDESDLLRIIYAKLPEETTNRYKVLTQKRQSENISKEEYNELLELVGLTEKHNVQRLESIIRLAKIRNTTTQELMKQLSLLPLHDA